MSRPRLLDLFAGAGGAAMGYHRAGFEVVGVDLAPQPHYPFTFHQADALTFPLDGFDAIHASPPCQLWTAYRRRGAGVGQDYPDLIGPTRQRLEQAGVPYVIENVPGAPLRQPITLCGSSFGLDLKRHRCFESSVPLLAPPCAHGWQTPRFPQATNRANLRHTVEVGAWRCADLAPAAMGIDWMSNDELSEAIPPAYTQFIGELLRAHLFRVTATPGATCTRVDASPSPHAAGGAPGMGEVAVALDLTSEVGGSRASAPPERPTSPSDPTSEGEAPGTATTGALLIGRDFASVSDATSPGEVAVPATAAPLHPRGQGTSAGGSTSRWPLVIRRRTGCQPRTDVEVREGIL